LSNQTAAYRFLLTRVKIVGHNRPQHNHEESLTNNKSVTPSKTNNNIMTIPTDNQIMFAPAQLIQESAPATNDDFFKVVEAKPTRMDFSVTNYNSSSAIRVTASEVMVDPNVPEAAITPIVVVALPANARRDGRSLPAARATPIRSVRAKRVLTPRVEAFKVRRKRQQAAAAFTGIVVGGVFLGPIGSLFGGLSAHAAAKTIGRARQARFEKRLSAASPSAGLS
jgi:hypothetical protein